MTPRRRLGANDGNVHGCSQLYAEGLIDLGVWAATGRTRAPEGRNRGGHTGDGLNGLREKLTVGPLHPCPKTHIYREDDVFDVLLGPPATADQESDALVGR